MFPRVTVRHPVAIASSAGVCAALLVLGIFAEAVATNVSDFTVVPATGGTQVPLTGGTRTLIGPSIDIAMYSNPDVFSVGLIFGLTLPTGFSWDPTVTAAPTIAIAAGMPAGFCTLTGSALTYGPGIAPSRVTFTLSGTHDVACTIALHDLRVRWVGGASTARSGQITVDWTIPGVGTGRADGGRLVAVDLGAQTGASGTPAVTQPATDATPASAPAEPLGRTVLGAVLSLFGALVGCCVVAMELLRRRVTRS